jgi:hypothetical protein
MRLQYRPIMRYAYYIHTHAHPAQIALQTFIFVVSEKQFYLYAGMNIASRSRWKHLALANRQFIGNSMQHTARHNTEA